ncbi:alpha/beta hydrolase [Chloroflexia bacterium SDU3-3]|nr:alpha/beta hydrolase [Chloroflexia bacterium SDU3-3]
MTKWTEQTIHANGIDIHFWRTGTGKPTILCAHGLTDHGHCWSLLASQLEGEYDLIMPDARGHGKTSVPEKGYRTQDRVADAIGLLDALGLEKVAIIGHSMGGESSGMLAALHPERVHLAILEDPAFFYNEARDTPPNVDQWAAEHKKVQEASIEQLVAHQHQQVPSWDERVLYDWAESKKQLNLHVFDWLREPVTPSAEYLPKIRVPTLIITAEAERGAIISPKIEQEIRQLNPSIEVTRLADAGHCVRYEQPEKYEQIVRAFLAEHMPR